MYLGVREGMGSPVLTLEMAVSRSVGSSQDQLLSYLPITFLAFKVYAFLTREGFLLPFCILCGTFALRVEDVMLSHHSSSQYDRDPCSLCVSALLDS